MHPGATNFVLTFKCWFSHWPIRADFLRQDFLGITRPFLLNVAVLCEICFHVSKMSMWPQRLGPYVSTRSALVCTWAQQSCWGTEAAYKQGCKNTGKWVYHPFCDSRDCPTLRVLSRDPQEIRQSSKMSRILLRALVGSPSTMPRFVGEGCDAKGACIAITGEQRPRLVKTRRDAWKSKDDHRVNGPTIVARIMTRVVGTRGGVLQREDNGFSGGLVWMHAVLQMLHIAENLSKNINYCS